MTVKRSIPTEYGGLLFRSKLEADWAIAFDKLGVVWEYEPRGRYWGEIYYCPDFWLPRSRQWVEVKAVWEPDDVRKIHAVIRHAPQRPHAGEETPNIPIICCGPEGVFYGYSDIRLGSVQDFILENASWLRLVRCGRCAGWYFADWQGSWACQCCGASDGNSHVLDELGSPLTDFPFLHGWAA